MSLTGAEILKHNKRRVSPVELPELEGLTVYVRSLSGAEIAALEAANDEDRKANRPNSLFFARVAVATLSDQEGARLFTDKDLAQVEQLDNVVLRKIYQAADELSGLSVESMEARLKNS